MEKIKFIKSKLDNLVCPSDKNEITFADASFPDLRIRVWQSGKKVFEVRKKLKGKSSRVKLGSFPGTTIEQARKKANTALATFSDGISPNAQKKADTARGTTLQQCLDDYIASRSNLKPSTADSYRQTLDQYLDGWLKKPLQNITRDKVEKKHKEIGENSPTRANVVMRILRALFEYAHGKYEDENGEPLFLHNPTKRLSHTKSWFKETRRDTFIKPTDIKAWHKGVTINPDAESKDPSISDTIRDYLLLILFTGLRRREAAGLRWDWIDFEHRTLIIPETKNGYPHTLPLSEFLFNLLDERQSEESDFVFPGSGETGHIEEPKKSIAIVRKRSGIYFTLHDLRRTFITTAESLGIRDYTLKRLLNHRSMGDVTDGYIVTDVDRLREPMQQIADRLLLLAKKSDKMLTFPAAAQQ